MFNAYFPATVSTRSGLHQAAHTGQGTSEPFALSTSLTSGLTSGLASGLSAEQPFPSRPRASSSTAGTSFLRNGRNYILTSGRKTWQQAQAEARRLGGNLVTINNRAEENWLKQTFGTQERFWTGLTDRHQEGQFEWVSGEAFVYQNWVSHSNRPAQSKQEDFVLLNAGVRRRWGDDQRANTQARGIIELPRQMTYNGNRYQLTPRALTWQQAQAEARRWGGNLVTINSQDEENWLKQTFGAEERFWTGLTDRRQEGQFEWVSGQQSTYRGWTSSITRSQAQPQVQAQPASGRSNISGQRNNTRDFVLMNVGRDRIWKARSASGQFLGVIEIPGLGLVNPEPGKSSIALERNTYTIDETDGVLEFALVRTGDTRQSATAQYQIYSDTAQAGTDFLGGLETVVFQPGETRKIARIPILNDTNREGTENFGFLMKGVSGAGASIGTIRTATVTLLDDESRLLNVQVEPISEAAGTALVRLTRSQRSNAASIDYWTTNGTAIAGSDYQETLGRVEFAPGEATKTIAIGIINDTLQEPNETFRLNFGNANGLELEGSNPLELTITDNDGGLVRETFLTGFNQPTAFAWTPNSDRLYVFEKGGVIKVSPNVANSTPTVFADLSRAVNDVQDRGGLSIAVHPQFYSGQPYIYVSYTYDPPEAYNNVNPSSRFDDPDQDGNRPARVVRLTADASTGYRTVVPNSEVVILGKNSTWANTSRPDGNSTNDPSIPESGRTTFDNGYDRYVQDYVKTDSQTHTIGQVAFGKDGLLYISIGDGSSYQLDRRTPSTLNINSLSGKMLRVDPLTGAGVADNPFYDGNPESNRSKVWQLGLRNPYRFTFLPGTSTPVIGDVGWWTWEEVNIGGRGANFGWPAYEGGYSENRGVNMEQRDYKEFPEIQAFIQTSGQTVTAPIYARSHGAGAKAITMGDFFRGELYIADVNQGTVEALTLDGQNQVVSVRQVADNMPYLVQIKTGADGNLYFVDLVSGSIGRWRST